MLPFYLPPPSSTTKKNCLNTAKVLPLLKKIFKFAIKILWLLFEVDRNSTRSLSSNNTCSMQGHVYIHLKPSVIN